MQVNDDLFLGNASAIGVLGPGSNDNPTAQAGAGPLGRTAFRNIVPLTLQAANVAALQALVVGAMVLTAGTGATVGVAPDGSGRPVIVLDVARSVSLTSTFNLSGVNLTVVGFDEYGALMSQKRVGPNNGTVNTLKTFKSVLSVSSDTASASTLSVGMGDTFGLQYLMADAGYLIRTAWAGVLAQDTGTFVAADLNAPTQATGDVRGTYLPSSASNGVRRLVVGMHLLGTQCGSNSTRAALIGPTQA